MSDVYALREEVKRAFSPGSTLEALLNGSKLATTDNLLEELSERTGIDPEKILGFIKGEQEKKINAALVAAEPALRAEASYKKRGLSHEYRHLLDVHLAEVGDDKLVLAASCLNNSGIPYYRLAKRPGGDYAGSFTDNEFNIAQKAYAAIFGEAHRFVMREANGKNAFVSYLRADEVMGRIKEWEKTRGAVAETEEDIPAVRIRTGDTEDVILPFSIRSRAPQ